MSSWHNLINSLSFNAHIEIIYGKSLHVLCFKYIKIKYTCHEFNEFNFVLTSIILWTC